MSDIERFIPFLSECADEASAIVRRYFRSDLAIDEKEDRSPVTKADKEIEEGFRARLAKTYPDHGIIGEEFGREREDAEFVWVIDPIDGTRAFMVGIPLFGTIIGLLHRRRPALGLIQQPFTNERWMGVANEWATLNGERIRVAKPRPLDAARLLIGSTGMFEGDMLKPYLRMMRAARWPQVASDAYAYGLLAMGCADLVIHRSIKLHDVAGAVPIITGAGGYMSDWKGVEVEMDFSGAIIAATSKGLAEEALEVLGKV